MATKKSRGSSERALIRELDDALTSSLVLSEVLSNVEGPLARLVQADSMALCVFRPGLPVSYDWMMTKVPPAFFADYPEWVKVGEDFVLRSVLTSPNEVMRDTEMVPRKVLEGSLMYRRSRELGIPLEQVMAVLMGTHGQGYHGGLSLYRERRRPFSERQKVLLQDVTPRLARVLRNCQMYSEMAFRGQLLEVISRTQGAAILVLAPPSTEVMRTELVTSILDRWFPSSRQGTSLLPRELMERLALLELGNAGVEADTWVRVDRDNARSLKVTFVQLPEQDRRRLWALFFKEVSHMIPLPAAWCSRLTSREAEVVSCVLKGWDIELIASELICKKETVKKHLQRIFDKLGVDNQKALISLALCS
ncbi:helix-turn-helix transcriptional regulator [Archangium violaceum]|uniref:helix-turn-helix transcriptional regulator n=1 Tax=Archangium violaceum TaxID=83451 RepID=UPI002B2F7185|nr:helix-turn-helix transcriptional regulator [Archangium violaceum]